MATALLFSATGQAASEPKLVKSDVSIEAQQTLIEKFTKVYLNIAPTNPSRAAVIQRLADLHAEKARRTFQMESEKGCQDCQGSKQDRTKALQYYQEVVAGSAPEAQGKIRLQMGHLHELNGDLDKAETQYLNVIENSKNNETTSEALFSVGELYFKRHDYDKAISNYQKMIDLPNSSQKGLAAYRKAWSLFNQGKIDAAIDGVEKLLKDPSLLHRGIEIGSANVDKQFQEEVSRDLATFYVKRNVQAGDHKKIYEFSPEQARLANVTYLANEAERLGQLKQALEIWGFVREHQAAPQDRLEASVHMAQLNMQSQNRAMAITEFEASLVLWGQLGSCAQPDVCTELQKRIKNFVIDWNKVEKKNPSVELLSAYQKYVETFPDSSEMMIWAAEIAKQQKSYQVALSLYLKASDLAGKQGTDLLESSLASAVEVAELSKERALLENAYTKYLASSKTKKLEIQVRYQLAKLMYDNKEYEKAAPALKEVAMIPGADQLSLKTQAADLALDALAILKRDTEIIAWSREFSKAFPSQAKNYLLVGQKTVLNHSAALATDTSGGGSVTNTDPNAETNRLQKAWDSLAQFQVNEAEAPEKLNYYKNKLILAEKLKRFAEAREACNQLLLQANLSEEDRSYALTRLAWLSEMALDFETALDASVKHSKMMDPKKKDANLKELSSQYLKLAMYADLAAKDSTQYYREYLKTSSDEAQKVAIATQLVKESPDAATEFQKQKALLSQKPDVYAALALNLYLKSHDEKIAKEVLGLEKLAHTDSGKVFKRLGILNDFNRVKATVTAHKIDSSSQKKLSSSLKGRIAELAKVEKLTSQAIQLGDWTAQVVTLDLLASQSERFYQDIIALPVPVGLTPAQEQEYLNELSVQAAPHLTKATDIKRKLSEFWAQSQVFEKLKVSAQTTPEPLKSAIIKEVEMLKAVAPENLVATLTQILEASQAKNGQDRQLASADATTTDLTSADRPTLATLESARQAVRENPMDRLKLTALLDLEKKAGRVKMVSYLEGRIQSIGESPLGATEQKRGNQ